MGSEARPASFFMTAGVTMTALSAAGKPSTPGLSPVTNRLTTFGARPAAAYKEVAGNVSDQFEG